ncbi:MAG: lamin tail domain-containing protein, partial [Patescibacteria group bacterium]|nr:lamin tail domain-containing protein [Patescibacteria group bacterium]
TSSPPAADWAYSRTGVSGNNVADFAVLPASPQNFLDFSGSLCNAASTTPALEATSTEETLASTTPSTETATSTAKNANIKIYRFLPDPAGDDSGNEWVELKNNDSQEKRQSKLLLDDKNTGSGPKTGALALSGLIVAGEIKRVTIPASHFTLNNSGGDEVNLYFADKTLADSAVYAASAYSGGVFEFRNGLWQPPVLNTGGASGGSVQASIYSAPAAFRLNEVFPNFLGEDAGNEWVEIYNAAASTSSLEGLFLDVGAAAAWTSGAYKLPKTLVPAGSVVQVVLPKNSITLKNSGKEKIKLFSPDRVLIDFVEYENAPESRSWQKNSSDKWEWNLPTPGEANNVPDVPPIIFSEVLPSPEADQDEFVELYNLATTTVGLEGFTLGIGSRTKTFLKDEEIQPESYRVLFADDLPVALRNSGQELFLKDKWGRVVSTLRYPAAQKGLAYASLDGKEFIWTASITPGGPNQLVLAGSFKNEPVLATISVPAVKKTTTASPKILASDAILASLSQQNQEQGVRLAALQAAVENLSRQLEEKESGQTVNDSAASGLPGLRYLVLAFACGFFLFWLYKFLPRNPSSGQPA